MALPEVARDWRRVRIATAPSVADRGITWKQLTVCVSGERQLEAIAWKVSSEDSVSSQAWFPEKCHGGTKGRQNPGESVDPFTYEK